MSPKRSTKYSKKDLNLAVAAVIDGSMSRKQASKLYGIPPTTLVDNIHGKGRTIKTLFSTRSFQDGKPPEFEFSLKRQFKKIQDCLRSQLRDGTFCDLELQTLGGCIKVHACFMASFSPKIARKLNILRTQNSTVVGGNMCLDINFNYCIIKTIVESFYSGLFSASLENLSELYTALKWLEIDELLDIVTSIWNLAEKENLISQDQRSYMTKSFKKPATSNQNDEDNVSVNMPFVSSLSQTDEESLSADFIPEIKLEVEEIKKEEAANHYPLVNNKEELYKNNSDPLPGSAEKSTEKVTVFNGYELSTSQNVDCLNETELASSQSSDIPGENEISTSKSIDLPTEIELSTSQSLDLPNETELSTSQSIDFLNENERTINRRASTRTRKKLTKQEYFYIAQKPKRLSRSVNEVTYEKNKLKGQDSNIYNGNSQTGNDCFSGTALNIKNSALSYSINSHFSEDMSSSNLAEGGSSSPYSERSNHVFSETNNDSCPLPNFSEDISSLSKTVEDGFPLSLSEGNKPFLSETNLEGRPSPNILERVKKKKKNATKAIRTFTFKRKKMIEFPEVEKFDDQGDQEEQEQAFLNGETSCLNCNKCESSFSNFDEYKNHIQNHPTYTCVNCSKVYFSIEILRKHNKSAHLKPRFEKCTHCDFTAKSHNHFRIHCIEVHKEFQPFKCTYEGCKYKNVSFKSLSRHYDRHLGKKVKPLPNRVCEKCGETFRGSLYYHHKPRCYDIQQTFLCDICGQSFRCFSYMELHRRTMHFGEKPYECKVCLKCFSSRPNLGRHMRIHDNIFPYSCTICMKKFRHSNSMKLHMSKHGETIVTK